MRAWDDTTTGVAALTIYVDDDDPRLEDYLAAATERYPVVVGPRARLVGWLNRAAPGKAADAFALGSIGDDHVPVTPGWDRLILGALTDLGTGVAYGDDRFMGQRLPTAAFITSDIVQTLGYLAPPELVHLYCDDFWLELGRAVGLRYLPDVVIEHVHPIAGKTDWDAVYTEANTTEAYSVDEATYHRYLAEQFATDVAKIEAAR